MAEIYYENEEFDVQLWHGRAEDVLPSLETESFGLVLTDPPYGVEYKSGMRAESWEIDGDGSCAEDREAVHEVLRHCVRLVGQNRHLYVFGPEVLRSVMDAKVSAPVQLIWQKNISMGDLTSPWGPAHEEFYFYTSLHRHGGKRGKESKLWRLRKGSVLEHGRRTGRTLRHPTEKPLSLLGELIESSSRVGDQVLDPFAGVGSTGVAAVLAGRGCVTVEVEEKYCAIAAERLARAVELRTQMKGL